MLGQVQSRMAESIQKQETQQADYMQQTEALTREVNKLKAQLKEMTDSIASNSPWLSGVSPREHIQLKNKVRLIHHANVALPSLPPLSPVLGWFKLISY